ncbi:MAG: putative RND superfamily exporter protein, partial [Glaciecola sp.]
MTIILDALRRTVAKRPGAVVATIIALSILFGFLSTQAGEPNADASMSTGSEASLTAERIDEVFGTDDAVFAQVAVTAPDVLSPQGLTAAADLRAAITANPAIAAVLLTGPEGAPAVTTWADVVFMAAAEQGIDVSTLDNDAVDALYASVLETLPAQQAARMSALLSADTDAGMAIAMLDPSANKADLTAALLAFGDLTIDGPAELHPFNFELLDAESQESIEGQMSKLLLLAIGLIVLILVAINRNIVDVFSSLVGLIFTIVWMNGVGTLLGPGFLGITDGMGEMAMAIPILLVGLGVDYGIHLSSRYREERLAGSNPADAASGAIGAVGTALTLATITTVVGFLTNLANPLAPMQDFGILAAVGVVSAFVIMTSFVPSMRLLADNRYESRTGKTRIQGATKNSGPGLLGRLAASLAPLASGRPLVVLGIAGLLTLGAGVAATGLSTEFSQTEFFPEGSEAVATINLLSEEFGGDLAENTQVLIEG